MKTQCHRGPVGGRAIELGLPFPPSVNHYYRRVGPRTLISRQGRAYRETVCGIFARLGVGPIQGPLAVAVDIHPPDRRRRDLDNTLKSLLDALEHAGAYHDDNQIVDLHVRRRHKINGGLALVRMRPCSSDPINETPSTPSTGT